MLHMTSLIPLAGPSSAWLQTLGRFHVAIVHFPIALLLVAGMAELWRSFRRSRAPSPTAIVCLVVGAATAILSAWMGWIHKGFGSFAGEQGRDLFIHQWLGIAAAIFAVGALITLASSRKQPARLWIYRSTTILCAIL